MTETRKVGQQNLRFDVGKSKKNIAFLKHGLTKAFLFYIKINSEITKKKSLKDVGNFFHFISVDCVIFYKKYLSALFINLSLQSIEGRT